MSRPCPFKLCRWTFALVVLALLQFRVTAQLLGGAPAQDDLLSPYGDAITEYLEQEYDYCIDDVDKDKKLTFEFQDTSLAEGCVPNLDSYLCTKMELKLYFATGGGERPIVDTENCKETTKLTTQVCRPGFAGSRPVGVPLDYEGALTPRRSNAVACCPGFFCPEKLACMIPCPKGAYCPRATRFADNCAPYNYLVPPPPAPPLCGGADIWGIAGRRDTIFCPPGQFCPDTRVQYPPDCPEGNYCRKGSTDPRKCSSLASCGLKEQKQDLHGAGLALVIVLLVILGMVYKCTDAMMNWRLEQAERRREAAQKKSRASVIATERWKKAVKAVIQQNKANRPARVQKRPANRVNASPPSAPPYQPSSPSPVYPPRNGDLYTAGDLYGGGAQAGAELYGGGAQASSDLYGASTGAGDLYGGQELRGAPQGGDLYGAPGGQGAADLYAPLHAPREAAQGKVDYKYVYQELAKLERNAKKTPEETLMDAILNNDVEDLMRNKVRVTLELEFRDVKLFLRSNGKQLLQGITGKLLPGRVTAVMGPSGAGKSMFLTAVAGKETYCNMTGQVLINGKEGSIEGYRRIIGFVPQDDIVHGNLTVEENLWFSANYRLPRSMPKKDKVVALERTILALGLDYIRHSRVGTVEKRGISGGQRKRVNVGLEMVIEPSLLILDEPTSGLDSTSSFLVIQALRREALRGVNIGVVLHQPSFKIFHMFDDVMFLARGGRVTYLGPVNEVEEYFNSLGFPVPNRVNPPDHYMDVLGGLVESEKGVDVETLPQLWRQHKGHDIMFKESAAVTVDVANDRQNLLHHGKETSLLTAAGWQNTLSALQTEAKAYYRDRMEEFKEMFRKEDNFSGRYTPGFMRQFWLVFGRTAKQRFREFRLQLQDYIILLITGAALGYLATTEDDKLGGPTAYTQTILGVSLLAMIAALRTFGGERLNYFREAASGINKLAYFVAKDVNDWLHILLKPLFYMALFYFFNDPRSTFADNYGITVALVYCVTGIAYVISIAMPPAAAQLTSAVISLVAVLLGGRVKSTGLVRALYQLSYPRWALQAYVLANARRYSGVFLLTRCAVLLAAKYNIREYGLCIFMLFFFGFLARLGALGCLFICNRDKQK